MNRMAFARVADKIVAETFEAIERNGAGRIDTEFDCGFPVNPTVAAVSPKRS